MARTRITNIACLNEYDPMAGPAIVWLDGVKESSPELLGAKGDRLAALCRSGFRVPRGFCLTTQAHLEYLMANGLGGTHGAERHRGALARASYPDNLRQAIIAAYRYLGADPVAVRSSAVEEDLPTASFAGQQDTFLNVHGESDVLAAINRCWASLWSDRAVAYRRERGRSTAEPLMAVVIQTMVRCDMAGVAFSVDPLGGTDSLVIEAAAGAGVAGGGSADVERWTVDRHCHPVTVPDLPRSLTEEQACRIAATVLALERLFGAPQDVEWGLSADRLCLFQSRPVTTASRSVFTDVIPGDNHLWTSGFLNERFPRPVSPLGWTLIRRLLEPLAIRDPLRFMGYRVPDSLPVLKLYRGHPFVNVRIFQILYKPFPDFLLPEDAGRYFPRSDTRLRREAEYPCCFFDPRFLMSLLWSFLHDPANWSPIHNCRRWAAFVREHEKTMKDLQQRFDGLSDQAELEAAWALIEDSQALNARLLAIHRWSLTSADIFYTLLRRILAAWLGAQRGPALCARLVSGLPNKSVELNQALQNLGSDHDWESFMIVYGHRSFSLDICHPTFAEDREQVKLLSGSATPQLDPAARASEREVTVKEIRQALRKQPWGRIKTRAFNLVLFYTQCYMPLREDQRFSWQKTLALQRQLSLWMGRQFTAKGWLKRPDDIFFATVDEVRQAAFGRAFHPDEIRRRRAEFDRLQQVFERDPGLSYPGFLRGNEPLADAGAEAIDILRGLPISPGLARGPARVISSPSQFVRIAPGDILVTRGADPGWTPIFGRIAALVMEVGGQLSHGAVLAREYGLPAVAGIQGAMRRLADGQEIVVDGLAGTVTPVIQ